MTHDVSSPNPAHLAEVVEFGTVDLSLKPMQPDRLNTSSVFPFKKLVVEQLRRA